MKKTRHTHDDDVYCQLCGGPIDFDDMAVVQGRMAPGESVADAMGSLATLDISGFPIDAFVSSPGCDAYAQGVEVTIPVCSGDCAVAVRIAAFLDADADGRVHDDEAQIVPGLRRRRPGDETTDRSFDRMARFESVLQAEMPDLAKRLGLDAPSPPLPRPGEPITPEARAHAEELLESTCAWCLELIPDDAPVEAIHVWLNEMNHDESARFGTITIGDRMVPGRYAEPGSLAAAECDMAFMLCSTSCAAHLRAAIELDRALKIVH